jgi:hypothetical protein
VSDHYFVDMNGRPIRDGDTVVYDPAPASGVGGLRAHIALSNGGRTLTADWGDPLGAVTLTNDGDAPETCEEVTVEVFREPGKRPKQERSGAASRNSHEHLQPPPRRLVNRRDGQREGV